MKNQANKTILLVLLLVLAASLASNNLLAGNATPTTDTAESIPIGTISESPSCNSNSSDFLRIEIQPQCRGKNLRGGGKQINPNGGPIRMEITLGNGDVVNTSQITFPVETTWPDNYGIICTWDNAHTNSHVDCPIVKPDGEVIYVHYLCQDSYEVDCKVIAKKANGAEVWNHAYCNSNYLNSQQAADENGVKKTVFRNSRQRRVQRHLNCTRTASGPEESNDPASEGDLNSEMSCQYLRKLDLTSASAYNTSHNHGVKYNRRVTCGLKKEIMGWSSRVAVSGDIGEPNGVYANRNLVSVEWNNANYPRRDRLREGRSNRYVTTPGSGQATVQLHFDQLDSDGSDPSHSKAQNLISESHFKTINWNSNENCLTIQPTFLGINSYCGSFYSPLMLFFSKKRPSFTGISHFPLYPDLSLIYWPEKSAPGYFLAIDRYGNGEIREASQLFKDGDGVSNGFESLRTHDKNRDGVINKLDPIFNSLVLWADKNSDGISSKKEILKLKEKGVTSINLGYNNAPSSFTKVANRAELRQSSTFQYKKGKKQVQGRVIDVWFGGVK
ncbi:MAG: hypothetical protein HN482_03940 [Bdellovibrionales bacterium]|nr:hypothetical protein [Bdellovibrionales bacterium]